MEGNNQDKWCINHSDIRGVAFCKRCNGYICIDCMIVVEGKRYCKKCYQDAQKQKTTPKKCINHPDKLGVAFCKKCGGYLCQECLIIKDGKKYCRKCYNKSAGVSDDTKTNSNKKLCDYCGTEVEKQSRFCQQCGAILIEKQRGSVNDTYITGIANQENVKDKNNPISVATGGQQWKSLLTENFIIASFLIFTAVIIFLFSFSDGIVALLSTSMLFKILFTVTFPIILLVGCYCLYKRIRNKSTNLISQIIITIIAISALSTFYTVLQLRRIKICEQNLNQGLVLLDSKQYQHAILAFEEANNIISGYKNTNQLIAETKKSIVQSTVDSCLNIAETRINEKKFEEAISLIDRAITLTGVTMKISNSYMKLIPGLLNDAESYLDKKDYYPAMWNAQKVLHIGKVTSSFTANKFINEMEKARRIDDNASSILALRKEERDKKIAQEEMAKKVQQVIDTLDERWRKRAAARKNTIIRLMEKYPYWDNDTIGSVACNLFFVGMTKEQLIESMGQPRDKNISVGSFGRHEQWIYGDYDGTYIYLEDGVVTSYQL